MYAGIGCTEFRRSFTNKHGRVAERGLCVVRRARVTTAKGPNALPFGTPGATDVAQALRFVASPLVRAASPASWARKVAMGAKCSRTRQIRRASCPRPRCPRRSGRSRARPDRARTRHRWERRLSDAADCFAVEGTVSAAGGGTRAGAHARLCHGAGACCL